MLTLCVQELCVMVMKNALPAYTTFNAAHPADEPVPITCTKAYFLRYKALFRIDYKSRKAARMACGQINNIGANLSFDSPEDVRAVGFVSMAVLKTVMIDVHIDQNFQPVALMAMIKDAPNIKHLYLTTMTDNTQVRLPEIWEEDGEVNNFCKKFGITWMRAWKNIQTIDIDLVCEQDVSKVAPFAGKFIQESWMGKTSDRDDDLVALMRRCLRLTRPTVRINAAQESKTYSNDPFC
jgi:hypothetical protein